MASLASASVIARTAVGFVYYGAAGLAVAYLVLPVQDLLGRLRGRRDDPQLRAQRTIHVSSRSFVVLLKWLGLIRVREKDTEVLRRRPRLVVANHPSLIDTPLLASYMPQADFVVGSKWADHPIFKRAVAAAGYLRAERGPNLVRDAVERLREGRSVVIYPEGTRTPSDGLGQFHRTAARVALEAGFDITPVLIQATPRILMKGQPWTAVPERTPEWRIEVGDPIHPADHVDGSEPRSRAARRLTAALKDHLEKGWTREEC